MNKSAIFAIIMRHLYNWRKDIDRMVDSFWWATIDIVFWGLTSSYLKNNFTNGVDVVAIFVGGIIFWTIVQNAQREINMPLLDEAWNRNLINIFTTPLKLSGFIIASILLGLLKLCITISFLSILAFILYHYNIFRFGIYLVPAMVNLLIVGWWVGFIINGLIFRYGYKIQAFAWAFIFILYPFSTVMFPRSVLPYWAQIVSYGLPTSYIFENMRGVLFTGHFSFQEMVVSFLLNIVYLIISIAFLSRMFEKAKDEGRLVKLN